MEDEVDQNTNQRRDLGNDEDLQMEFDQNHEYQDQELKDKVLFAVQGLGSVRTIQKNGRQFDAYIKGAHCQQSIKDLVKFIRTDLPDNPKVKLILSKLNIVQSDLIELLQLQVEDKKLSFWLIALLQLLTSKPSDDLNSEQKQTLLDALRQYKQSFTKHQCLTILTMHIADYFKTPKEQRQKAHYQMLEFILLLIRNLLQIPDSKADKKALHNHFLTTFIRQEMFNSILYLIQTQKGQIMTKIDIPLLEIFYYTFTCFDPNILYNPESKRDYFKQVLECKANKIPLPPRHSRFMPNFKIKSDVGISRISHNLNRERQPILNQRQIPHRTVQLKKVQKIELESLSQNFMQMQFQVLEDGQHLTRTIHQLVFDLSKQFIQIQLPQLKDLVFDQIYKETSKVTPQNVIQYLLLCNWAIEMTRKKYKFQKAQAKDQVSKQNVQFDLGQIAEIMQNAHFQLIYKTLFKEATRQKKKDFKVNTFNAALKLFLNYLNVISDISISLRQLDRKNANTLMANIFRHDIARILKIGFIQITHEGILSTLILTCHKFYSMLSKYSDGKVLTIRTDKLLKRKNKKKMRRQEDQENMKDFISEDSDDNQDGSNSYHEGQDQDNSNKKQKVKNHKQKNTTSRIQQANEAQMFQERKFNEISEFAIIAEYAIITKYLIFLKNQRFLHNSNEFNDAIFFYFDNITRLLRGQWLFYQAQTLVIFQGIMTAAAQLIKKDKKNIQKIRLVRKICKQFLHLLKNNNLALIESLFKYPNLQLKQKIIKNYDQGYEGPVQIQNNMFTDQ